MSVMVFNVALKPSGAISNSRLLISIALKSRGNLCGYSNEQLPRWDLAARGSGSSDFYPPELCKVFFFSAVIRCGLMQAPSHWPVKLITNSWHFYSKLQFVNFDEVIRIIIVQNTYCWVLTLATCVLAPPPAQGTYWVLTCYTDSYLGLWGLTHTRDLRQSTTQNYLFMTGSKFADWLQHTALHSHMELLFCLKVRKSNFGLHLQSEMNGAPAVAAWCLALEICQSRFRHFCME